MQTSSSSLSQVNWFFIDAIRTTEYAFNFCDRVRQKYFKLSNDHGYLLIPSNVHTPAANRLYYFDNIISRVGRKMICLQTDQGKVMRFFYSGRPAYLLAITCRFLLCFTKMKTLNRELTILRLM